MASQPSTERMYYVYILKSRKDNSKTYVGFTGNLHKRLIEHNLDTQTFTKRYSPWAIETYIGFLDKKKAIEFEKYLKVGSGKAFLNKHLIGRNSK